MKAVSDQPISFFHSSLPLSISKRRYVPSISRMIIVLSAISYRCLAAKAPFNAAPIPFADMDGEPSEEQDTKVQQHNAERTSGTAEQLMQNIRDGVYIPIGFRCPKLVKEVQALIDGGLALTKTQQMAQAVPSGCEQLCTYRSGTRPLFYTDIPQTQAIRQTLLRHPLPLKSR